MSRGFNQVVLLGNLTRDVEVRYKNKGDGAWCRFSLACGYAVNRGGQWEEACDFVPCLAFGTVAETIGKHCRKGDPILAIGSVKTSKYTKEGRDVWQTNIYVNNFRFAGGKRRDEGASGVSGGMNDSTAEDLDAELYAQDLPF